MQILPISDQILILQKHFFQIIIIVQKFIDSYILTLPIQLVVD